MYKRTFLSLLLTAVLSSPLYAAEHEISLRVKEGPYTGSRSESAVTATIEDQVLTALFADMTASSIVVYEETNPETILFSQNYVSAYSAQADLTSLPSGDYVVEIFAFDEWWIGDFVIE